MKDWTLQELLDWTKNYFVQNNIAEPRLEAEVLLACALKLDRINLYIQHDRPVNQEERSRFREMIKSRVAGEPTAYLVGQKEFMSLPFAVDRRVLIPRPDTEILVEEAIKMLQAMDGIVKVADVGTGSGAIAVSIARYLKNTIITAIDIDPEAILIAQSNARLNGVEDRINFLVGDLLHQAPDIRFHLIAANLPYIPTEELPKLPKEVKDFEPTRALDGGPGGIRFYIELIPQAAKCLEADGFLLMEISNGCQAESVLRLLGDEWREQYIVKDLGGRDRVVAARKR